MIEAYNDKIVLSGENLEHYHYKGMPILKGYKRRERKVVKREIIRSEQKEKTNFSVNRARTQIRRIVNSNLDLNKFLTLTSKMTDVVESNKCFNLFTQRMKDRFPEFRYFAIAEYQKDVDYHGKAKEKDGAVHYHLLCNLRYVRQKELLEIWGHGFVFIERIDRIRNIGAYLSKYLQKEMCDKRMFGKKKYFHSRDLKKPVEVTGENAINFLKDGKDNLELIRESEFENEYRGMIEYKTYKFKKYL